MSTKVKDSLHELIHSLSKSEKRYYKLYASRHLSGEGSTMITLFDYIARQQQYDEQALFRHFRGKAFLNQFSTVKKRVYDQVLQALHAFHTNSSVENQVNRMLHQAHILYEKSLYDQCLRYLRSTEKLAARHDLFAARIAINKLKNSIVETRGYRTDEETIEQLKRSTEKALSQERLILDLRHIKSKLFQQLQLSGTAQSETDHATIDRLMTSIPDEELRAAFGSTESAYLYYHIHAAYHFAKGQLAESLHYTEQTIRHLTGHKQYTNERPNALISALTNACYLAESLGQYDKSQLFLNTLKQFEQQQEISASEDLRIKLFSSRYSIELNLLTVKGQFEEARQTGQDVLAGLEQFSEKITASRRAFLLVQLAVTEIGCERPAKALHYVNTILNDTQLDDTESIVAAAHLLNLVVHFELRNYDHLQYIMRNTQRLLKTTSRLGAFETVFMQYLGKLMKAHVVDFPELFGELEEQLRPVTTSRRLQAEHNFDYLAWIAAKRCKTTFAKKVSERYNAALSA